MTNFSHIIALSDLMRKHRLNQKQLAELANLDKLVIKNILNGKRKINTMIAMKLGEVFGTTAQFWTMLQYKYDNFKENNYL